MVEGIGGLLFPEHIAQLWTEEARKGDPEAPEIQVVTVHNYRRFSLPTKPGVKTKNRYEHNPMPEPLGARGPRQPAWLKSQEQELRDWWHSRAGQGAKGTKKPRKEKP